MTVGVKLCADQNTADRDVLELLPSADLPQATAGHRGRLTQGVMTGWR